MNNKIAIAGFLALTIFVLGAAGCAKPATFESLQKIELAKHLTDSNVKMYGAFWCGHCDDQKKLFEKEAFEFVNYIECSTPDGTAQLEVCIVEDIKAYPTWEFADGTREAKVFSLKELAEKTGFDMEAEPTQPENGAIVE